MRRMRESGGPAATAATGREECGRLEKGAQGGWNGVIYDPKGAWHVRGGGRWVVEAPGVGGGGGLGDGKGNGRGGLGAGKVNDRGDSGEGKGDGCVSGSGEGKGPGPFQLYGSVPKEGAEVGEKPLPEARLSDMETEGGREGDGEDGREESVVSPF